jgi:adenosylhomocysteine nucleosidase
LPVKNVLVVAAEDFEFAGILSHADRVVRPGWKVQFSRIAVLNGMRLLMAADGPGPRLAGMAAEEVKNREPFQAVVSTGLCGALDPALSAGEIFVASEVNGWAARQPVTAMKFRTGRLLSMDRVAGSAEEKAQLYAAGACVVEMEATAVESRAREWRLPFFCVRVVSDTAGEDIALDLNEMRDAEGRFSRSRIVVRALRSPLRLIPELLRLNRNSGRAAKALGDFFANCSF